MLQRHLLGLETAAAAVSTSMPIVRVLMARSALIASAGSPGASKMPWYSSGSTKSLRSGWPDPVLRHRGCRRRSGCSEKADAEEIEALALEPVRDRPDDATHVGQDRVEYAASDADQRELMACAVRRTGDTRPRSDRPPCDRPRKGSTRHDEYSSSGSSRATDRTAPNARQTYGRRRYARRSTAKSPSL
jgi:hypothetical protein